MTRRTSILAAILAIGATACLAQTGMVVSTEWLAGHLDDKSVVVLHVGTAADYQAGHIPGARLIALTDISITGERGLRLELPPVEALRDAFRKVGVSDTSRIAIYPSGDSVQSATRVWFTLDYLGLGDRAALVDGGLALWRAEGRPVSTEVPQVEPAPQLTVRAHPERVTDAEYVLQHAGDGSIDLVDARLPEFYTGASAGMFPRAGHIPGARNVPFITLLDTSRKLKPRAELERLMGSPKPTVTYCHLGQQATLVYFVSRYLGRPAKLYDGSFQDWSTRPGLPVVKTAP